MLTLALIGFVGGLITGISPCILPVLPVIFFSGGVQSAGTQTDGVEKPVSRWRPYLVILGLVVSFSLFTLIGSLLLAVLHLPQDFIRWAGLVVLVLVGVGLIFPRFESLLEKPFSWIPQRSVGTERGGFVLGIALGAVYVPCAGPVLAAITVAGSTGKIGVETIVLTLTFAVGAALPLLVFALAGRGVAKRVKSFRKHQRGIRMTGGIVMIALAVGLVFNVPQLLQRVIPDYTSALQDTIGNSSQVQDKLALGGLVNEQNKNLDKCHNNATTLESCGTAPDLTGIQQWFNTPGNAAVSLDSLRGRVVLVDFWAYSCINCQRSVPHVVAWDKAYRAGGLTVIGVHSPEYSFEKVPANVKAGAVALGIRYPVALDNDLATWTNYRNRYWPAHYLIDASGTVRNVQFGEGNYANTESLIRELLTDADPTLQLPAVTEVADSTPRANTTQETYLSPNKVVNFGGDERYSSKTTSFSYPAKLAPDSFALNGEWKLDGQYIEPSSSRASIKLNYSASEVRMVLAGEGTVTVEANGETSTIRVSGTPKSYRLLKSGQLEKGTLRVSLGSGIQAYSFTFG
jgi:cytochrome c biogenesis protein CcdA/thiol-disulfide isomerase/thioredoxin